MRIIDWSSDVCSSDLVSQHLADDLPRRLVDKPQIRIELRGRVGDEDLWTVQDVHVGGDCDIATMKLRPDSSKTRARSHESSEARRVGNECVGTYRSRWWPYHKKKNKREYRKTH